MNEILIKTEIELKNKFKYLSRNERVTFICKGCGCIDIKTIGALRNYFLCKKCVIKEANKNRAKTNLKKYGVEYPSKLKDVKSKQAKTNLKKYGAKSVLQTEICKKAFEEKYGVDNPFKLKEIQNKIKETNLKKYGVDNPGKLDEIKKRRAETNFERYGIKYSFVVHNHSRYEYDDLNFDSKPELAFYIFCKDHGYDIKRSNTRFIFRYNDKDYGYYPDFEADGNFYEIKGSQFVNLDGTWKNPYDESQNGLYEAKHQCAIKNNVRILYKNQYDKFIEYVDKKYTSDFLNLFRKDLDFPYLNQNLNDISDMGLIHHFHKSIYEATKLNKSSPLEAWKNKNIIRTVALNRLKYVKSCRPSDILQGFSVTRIAPKVSVFKPILAEELTNKYLSCYNKIVDPFSGFSGRLLGVTNTGKSYVGKDINEKHVKESNEIINYNHITNANVYVEDLLKKTDVETFDCLFTCPPYGAKEHWNKNKDEVEKTCDEWIDLCLQHYKCKRYLFVVDYTEKYKKFVVADKLDKKSGLFHKMNECIILIDRGETNNEC